SKVMSELQRVADRLFVDFSHEADIARIVWAKIANDPTFAFKIKNISVPWILPSWSGRLDDFFIVPKHLERYHVLAIDGSQIYPDRHQGTACSLINIGSVILDYGIKKRSVLLDSKPLVFVGDEDSQLHETPQELVNCRRQEWEFKAGLHYSLEMKKKSVDKEPSIFLFDGSIIFWHLESKDQEVKVRFLASYLDSLQKLYEEKILIAGYISMTKSKELVNLIRVALTEFCDDLKLENLVNAESSVDHMTDAQIVRFFLKPFTRTTIFKNHSNITKHYPEHLHPHFFYLHVGSEIVRIEIPAWIARDSKLVQMVVRMVTDQACKGDGYPVALAEAHEQAVVKGPDRDFFYHLVRKVGSSEQYRQKYSQKVRNKRGIRI
ncbi:DNA double-strand break repair nuclease NurA, partial [bacterium]|nr:DNA double-strand break repair nuclease NurA [bacterium]